MVFGSDDEKSITRAIQCAFPNSSLALCTLHLKKNVARHLKDKVGVASRQRNLLIHQLFGAEGLSNSSDEVTFDVRLENLTTMWPEQDTRYLNRIAQQIHDHVLKLHWNGQLQDTHWTNNNAESLNHTLKHMVEWKPRELPDLINKLRTLAKAQQVEIARAIIGRGEFQLAPHNTHKLLQGNLWVAMTEVQKRKHIATLRQSVRPPGSVQSSSSCFHVTGTPTKGKKPGQRKRKRAERTATAKRMKLGNE